MAFDDTFAATELAVLGDNTTPMGTAMLGNDFGMVVTANVTRDADKEEIEGAGGNLRAVVLKKIRFELELETIFDSGVEPPGLMEQITLPFAGVTGRVMKASIKWERGKERMLSITASSWDALEDAVAYKLDTVTGVFTSMDA